MARRSVRANPVFVNGTGLGPRAGWILPGARAAKGQNDHSRGVKTAAVGDQAKSRGVETAALGDQACWKQALKSHCRLAFLLAPEGLEPIALGL
jgi:hypothetical protein